MINTDKIGAGKLRALLMDFHAVEAVVLEGADAP